MQISRIRLTDTRRTQGTRTELTTKPLQVAEPIALQARIQALTRAERTTSSLAPIPQERAESDPHIVVERAEGLARIAVPKYRGPARSSVIDRPQWSRRANVRLRAASAPHFLADAGQRPRRGIDMRVPPGPAVAVAVVPQREAQKVEALPRRSDAHDARLVPVHRQPEVLFERPFEPRQMRGPM